MRSFLKNSCALSFQIIEGDIKHPRASEEEKSRDTSSESLAMERSNSYTLTAEDQLSNLFAEASASESSDTLDSSTDEDSDATVPYDGVTPAPAQEGKGKKSTSKEASAAPTDVRNEETDEEDPPSGTEKTEDPDASVDGEDRFVTPPKKRRSRRQRGEDPPPTAGLKETIRAASRRSARRAEGRTSGTEEEDKNESSENEHKDPQAPGDGTPGVPPDEPGEPPHPGESNAAKDQEKNAQFANYVKSVERRMKRLQKKLRKERRRSRHSGRRRRIHFTKTGQRDFRGIVDRAKAIKTLTQHTISPSLWDALPVSVRVEAYNRANGHIWDSIVESLGYEHSHLLIQLREGDGKAAWDRMTKLHAENTMGAQAHWLAMLMECSYQSVVGAGFGSIRLYAEALQRINKQYKRASGEFVPPQVLMSRLLSLPDRYDTIIDDIETTMANRERSGTEPLSFAEVVHRIVAYENRQKRRNRKKVRSFHKHDRNRGDRREWRRRSRDRAFTAHDQPQKTGFDKSKIECYRCGRLGHMARECRETTDVHGKPIAAGGRRTSHGATTVQRADERRKKKHPKGGRKSIRGFLAQERHSQVNNMGGEADQLKCPEKDKIILDSGATVHCCVKGTTLTNARATRKVIQAAGSQTLSAQTIGDWGKLVDTVAVTGLRSALASTGRLADHYQAALIFTPTKVLTMPISQLNASLRGKADVLGHRAADGLYLADIKKINKTFTAGRGYTSPRVHAVGATAQSIDINRLDHNEEEEENAEVLHALAVWQNRSQLGSFERPELRRYHGDSYRDSARTVGAGRGVRRAHSPNAGETIWRARGPIVRRPIGQHGGKIRFIDLCSGIGGFTTAGIRAGWEPIASVDYCQSLQKWYSWNFQHTFECVDLTKKEQVRRLHQRYKNVDVCLFAPPCQPYSLAGRRQKGDARSNVAVAGTDLILQWRPRLAVIECVANFISCQTNATYRKDVLPRLTNAGYHVYVARCNAAQCGVPVRRDRVFVVCTLYERDNALEKRMEALSLKPMMPLSEWFPSLQLVCHQPCHSSPAVFDARTSPHPTMRTGSLIPLDKTKYKRRRGDAGAIQDAVALTLKQKLALAGLGVGFHWPRKGSKCSHACCKRYAKSRWGGTLMARSFGNIVVPEQALQVLKNCNVESLRAHDAPRGTTVGAKVNPARLPRSCRAKRHVVTAHAALGVSKGLSKKKRRRMPDRGPTMSRAPGTVAERVMRLHRRMAHAGRQKMLRMLKDNANSDEWRGITPADVEALEFCETCARSKLTKQPHGKLRKTRDRMKGPNLLIHTDSMMRAVPSIPRKDIYVQAFVDDCTRYAWIETFRRKTFEDFSAMLTRAEAKMASQYTGSAEYRASGSGHGTRPVQRYFTDQASEMISAKQRHRLARLFIDLTVVAPSAKLSNGVAERMNRTVLDYARSLLVEASLPIVFWAQALQMAVFIYNRLPHSANGGKSPYEMYYGYPPKDSDRIKVFGCTCYVHEEKARRDHKSKLDPTARGCVYLGPSPDDKRSHLYFNPRTSKVLRSTSVVFDEFSPGGPLVENNGLVRKRMKDLTANKWKPTRRHLGGNQEVTQPAPSAGPDPAAEEENKDAPTVDIGSSDDDTWNKTHHAQEDETLADIAEMYGVELEELIYHNVGLPGCDPHTGYTNPKARLREGTGLWLPDDCKRVVTEKESIYPPKPPTALELAEEDDAGHSTEETAEEPEEAEGSDAGQEAPWSNRLRKRKPVHKPELRRATLDVETIAAPPAGATVIGESPMDDIRIHRAFDEASIRIDRRAAKAAQLIAGVPTGNKKRKRDRARGSLLKIEKITREAEELFGTAYRIHMYIEKEKEANPGRTLGNMKARDVPTPRSYKEALSGDFADHWNAAVLKELQNLADHGVYKWCELPQGAARPIDTTWAWRVKPTSTGQVDKLKARLVARGFKEKYGVSFSETFAPVTTLTTWRACLAEASRKPWRVDVWDVSSAYLLSDIPEETPIYVKPFEGLKPPKGYRVTPRTALRLLKGLYGLKAAGRLWNITIDAKLKKLGFRQSRNDPCLYIKEEGEKKIRLNLHVDDCCATYTDVEFYSDFRAELEKSYKLSSSTDSNLFLGNVIERTSDGGIQIHQEHYIEEVLKKFQCEHWKVVPTPARDSITLHKGQSPTTDEERARMAKMPYRQVVGSLMWLTVCTRPDLAQALGACARFSANPGEEHWKALKWCLRYLKGTKSLCLRYGRKVADMPFSPLHGNVDASWGDDLDDRKSTSGYNFISHGGPITWRSRKQRSVALSSCESEYMAANLAGRTAVWLVRLYKEDFGYDDLSVTTYGDLSEKEFQGSRPLTIFEDNTGCIQLSRNPVHHGRSKHVEIRYHWLRDKCREGILKLSKIDTKLNTADIFTKPTKRSTFEFLRDKLMSPREKPKEAPASALTGEMKEEAPTRCLVCGEAGHSIVDCPSIFRPSEIAEESIESKDSESLLVARPDGQHKGSNDMSSRLDNVWHLCHRTTQWWTQMVERAAGNAGVDGSPGVNMDILIPAFLHVLLVDQLMAYLGSVGITHSPPQEATLAINTLRHRIGQLAE